jgi:hypothetical protein
LVAHLSRRSARLARYRAVALALALGAIVLAGGFVSVRSQTDRATTPPRASRELPADAALPAAGEHTVAFPLTVEPGKRYLVDSAGTPFLIQGDTAWSLIAELTREEVDRYVADRRARGFNTILVSLIEYHYARHAPANAYGERPFRSWPVAALASLDVLLPVSLFTDYGAPNEAYFDHADWVLRRAAEEGFLVLLTPSYIGCCSDGWYRAMVANGVDQLSDYGEYLGRRYRDFTNILWVHAGDGDPPRKDLVSAIAEGIQRYDPRALHTAHGAPDSAVADYWAGAGWLDINNVYTYGPVYERALAQYARRDRMPFFLIESAYENEHGAAEQRLRTQAYQAVLSGAAGQVFGNNPIWHFDGPGVYAAPIGWREALDSRGAQSMTHLRALFGSIPWWELRPDIENKLLIAGLGSSEERAVAALAVDRSFALLYLPSHREITVDLTQLAGPEVRARWYDPAAGRFTDMEATFDASASRRFRPLRPPNNAGFDDSVLLLESRS